MNAKSSPLVKGLNQGRGEMTNVTTVVVCD
jgi:hypothetical protein